MIQLTPDECRVLGVLVEKAQTTPQQYPMTLNALVNGANQKNNREPVTSLTEEQVLTAVDGLRTKGMAREVSLSGSRVAKFRHTAREALEISTSDLVVLTELLLRGPQTLGEIRGRASRMHPLESLEVTQNILEGLKGRAEPMVKQLSPAPGSRAPRFAQLLCANLHPIDAPSPAAPRPHASVALITSPASSDDLKRRVADLEARIIRLEKALEASAIGGAGFPTDAD